MSDRSVLKALAVLDALGDSDEGMTLTELAGFVDFPVSTTHRLLKTLASQGYVERDRLSGRYLLGSKILRLQSARAGRITLTRTAFPFLRQLTREVDETANLSTFSDGQVVYLESLAADRAIGFYSPPGTIVPAHCTAMGKVLLAYLPRDELNEWLGTHELVAATPDSIVDADQLIARLGRVRQDGYAVDDGEWVTGVRCVAAPVRDYSGQVIAAASVSAPSGRLSPEREQDVIEAVVRACAGISAGLGNG